MKAMREDLQRDSDDLDAEIQKYKQEAEQIAESKEDEEKEEELSEKEILENEAERKANLVSHEEFKILTSRVDTMDNSIGNIVGRVRKTLIHF